MNVAGTELTARQLYDILRLRAEVFVVEQQCVYQDLDGQDLLATTRHFWLGGVDCYLRVLSGPDGVHRIGRVVTAKQARGQGLAAKLMGEAVAFIGDDDSVLAAQTYAQDLYTRFGYVAEGDEYFEDGISHITMWRRVARPR
ncbi:GNAT family N-acetyltransferase [Amycolatopsis pigmentata]|uniref:GNAT family N-acetyltransferase n=1 Tax=Amycolatopsis pigmentata TaxID=450801 RepID=A0ABW5G6N8_9PSEU